MVKNLFHSILTPIARSSYCSSKEKYSSIVLEQFAEAVGDKKDRSRLVITKTKVETVVCHTRTTGIRKVYFSCKFTVEQRLAISDCSR
jgi:hypothetical protein